MSDYTMQEVERIRDDHAAEIATLRAENERLRGKLVEIFEGYGPLHLSKYCRDVSKEALK